MPRRERPYPALLPDGDDTGGLGRRRLPSWRQPVSATGRRSRAGTVRSGCAPTVSNGAAERFTQTVRIPAALAPTLSNALQVTSRTCPAGRARPPGRVPVHHGRGLEHADLIGADPLAEEIPKTTVIKTVADHDAGPVGKHRQLVPHSGERLQSGNGCR